MNLFQAVILVSLIGNAGLGLFVLLSNPRRRINRSFFILTGLLMLWLGAMFMVPLQSTEARMGLYIRLTSATATLIPLGIFLLHRAIIQPDERVREAAYRLRYWLFACLALVALCFSPFFLLSTAFPTAGQTVPVSRYGPGFVPFLVYFFAVVVAMAVEFWKSAKTTSGAQRAENQFLQLGLWLSFSSGLSLFGAAVLGDLQEVSRFMPLATLVWAGIVAYGIATRRILSASAVLQQAVAHGLMAAYLVVLYLFSQWLCRHLLRWVVPDPDYLSHLLAALAVALSVTPAHGRIQSFSHRLFASGDTLNVNVLLERAGQIFREVSTEAALMTNFSDLVSNAFGTTKVLLLFPGEAGSYVQAHPEGAVGKPVRFQSDNAVLELLRRDRDAFTVDTLHRMRSSPVVQAALAVLKETGATLAAGGFMRGEMKTVLMLYPKKSRRIYDLNDQQSLQLLCNQFAVAMENANLYTAVRNSKIYNDILLDSLTSGIVAVNSDRRVTVFNLCAQGLTGLPEARVVDQSMAVLPVALREGLEAILDGQGAFRDRDMRIGRGNEEISIRVSGSLFHGHTGQSLGALLVFNDMTLLREMEEQIRRTDRLSSLGTLSAGMAHEIKNPLVTIKTFAQLLPQQHHDSEFRNTFFDLVGQEVNRIDTIVNRLLNFARPAPPSLQPVSLHGILENALRLVEPQLSRNEMTLERHLEAPRDRIAADAEQLNQAFVNFFLNALQAMGQGGTLSVSTSVLKKSDGIFGAAGAPDGDRIQVDVRDTGCGIDAGDLGRIFDPFFSTKEHGVGLGLSVSHGIIREHGGTIDAESQKGRGSVFHVQFPLLPPQEPYPP